MQTNEEHSVAVTVKGKVVKNDLDLGITDLSRMKSEQIVEGMALTIKIESPLQSDSNKPLQKDIVKCTKKYNCNTCGKEFKTRNYLTAHEKIHTVEKTL